VSVIPRDILERAREGCQSLIDQLKTMPMSNIVNAIEQIKACQIIIQPIEAKEITTDSCLSTCDISLLVGRQKRAKIIDKKFRHHFIHYEKSDNKELEKLRVAHECGHCYFAWPLTKERKIYTAIIPKVNLELYLVRFDLEDECLADAFASIMVNYPFSSSEEYPDVVIDKILLDKIEEYAEKGYLKSTSFAK